MNEPAQSQHSRWLVPFLALTIAGATAALFWPAVHYKLLVYDDHDYVTGNPWVQNGVTFETVRWAFGNAYASNWHPLTWLSHAIDWQLSGNNPYGHHLTNILLHAINAALLFLLLNNWTKATWRSAFVAAVFAWHPLRVESVAWVSERKDVLSALFFFLTLMAYGKYVSKSKVQSPKSKVWYGITLLMFALGLMSKPMLVTLPFVLLLLDAWPLQRATGDTWQLSKKTWLRLVAEKIPLLILVVVSSVVTFHAQKAGGALRDFSMESRLANAPVAIVSYIWKLVWPANLAVIYPFKPVPATDAIFATIGLVAVSVLALRTAKHRGYVFAGWFWFLGMLVPVSGLIQVGNQSMADRYTYLPVIGLTIIATWGLFEILERLRRPKAICAIAVILVLAAMPPVTRTYLACWENTDKLFRHSVSVTGPHTVALKNLGVYAHENMRLEEARGYFQQSLEIEPNDQPTMFNLGAVLLQMGKIEESLNYLRRATNWIVGFHEAEAYGNVGLLLSAANQPADAALFYRKALEANPNHLSTLNNYAWLLATSPDDSVRNGQEAIALAERACELTENKAPVLLGTLAAAYAEAARFPEAIATATTARDKAKASGQADVVDANEKLLLLYRQGKPFREEPR